MRTWNRVAQCTGREFNVPATKRAQTLQELCLDGFHVQLQRRGRWWRRTLRHDRRRRGGNRRSSGLRHRRGDRRNRRLDRRRYWNLAWRFSGYDTSRNFWLWSVGKFDDDSRWQDGSGAGVVGCAGFSLVSKSFSRPASSDISCCNSECRCLSHSRSQRS